MDSFGLVPGESHHSKSPKSFAGVIRERKHRSKTFLLPLSLSLSPRKGPSSAEPLPSPSFLFWAGKSFPAVELEGGGRSSCGEQSPHPPPDPFLTFPSVNSWRPEGPCSPQGGCPVPLPSISWENGTNDGKNGTTHDVPAAQLSLPSGSAVENREREGIVPKPSFATCPPGASGKASEGP